MIQSIIQDISYKELKLALFSGEVDLSALNLFAEKELYVNELELTIHAAIIGTSHFVQVKRRDEVFTEMLACNSDQDFGLKEDFLQPIYSMNNSISRRMGDANYQFTQEVHSLSKVSKELQKEWDDLLEKEPIISMAYNFNDHTHFPSAETKIAIQSQGNQLSIYTLHEYQEEDKVVRTKSNYSIIA